MTPSNIDYDKLRKLAEAADSRDHKDYYVYDVLVTSEEYEFNSAVNPATIIALLDELDSKINNIFELVDKLNAQTDKVIKLQSQLALCKEALEFYADTATWSPTECSANSTMLHYKREDTDETLCGGKRARETLAKLEKE